jgi:hypothetical protein
MYENTFRAYLLDCCYSVWVCILVETSHKTASFLSANHKWTFMMSHVLEHESMEVCTCYHLKEDSEEY